MMSMMLIRRIPNQIMQNAQYCIKTRNPKPSPMASKKERRMTYQHVHKSCIPEEKTSLREETAELKAENPQSLLSDPDPKQRYFSNEEMADASGMQRLMTSLVEYA
jgi:hypothetical protein